jgi:3-dehydroquinate synthetase
VEAASYYSLRHGEAVAIGMVAVARLAEERSLCEPGLASLLTRVLTNFDLPVEIPAGLNPSTFINAVKVDKKRAGGLVRFAVPVKIGEVKTGIVLDVDFAALLPEAA